MKTAPALPSRPIWPEAEIIAEPTKRASEPRVLVHRHVSDLCGPNGEELCVFPSYPAISLFTGAGGMDIGLEQAGFCTVVQHEWDQCACLTLMANRPEYFRHSALIQGDLKSTPTSMILQEGGLRVGETYLLTGGPPCQGFTQANKKAAKGSYDSRNDLVFEWLRVVRESQPRFFMFENVPGFVHFKGKIEGKSYVETFLRAAWDAYYVPVYGLIDACDYGVPQRRVRFICAGTRRDLAEIEGQVASLPAGHCFADRDLGTLRLFDGGLFQEEADLITHAPGIRYFPDRPFLVPPRPNDGENGRTKGFLKFFRDLERDEPDRIVRQLAS